ncbi:MAG: hypothetical protein LBD79_05510 [Treponema sp.]|jgi:hypothetical protein|nr:hypothetical protein [Treponema sp.]
MIKKRFALLSALGLLLFSCKQSAIFYEISLEVEAIEPQIKGSPTNIVQQGDSLYVASRFGSAIYEYKDSEWVPLSPSPGNIIELAATKGALYALTGTPGSLDLQKFSIDSKTWTSIGTKGYNVQSIYGAEDYLFAGAIADHSTNPPTCSILYVEDDGASELTSLASKTSLLKGAVYDGTMYYLATFGSGILPFTEPLSDPLAQQKVADPDHNNIVGIIKVGDKIVAVSRDGYILYGAPTFVAVKALDSYFTGALATWKPEPKAASPRLLLLGIQGEGSTSTTHGYREILLNEDGTLNPDAMSLKESGKNEISSVKDYDDERNGYEQYVVTIGRHPLSSIIQAPDGILFATTTKDGLWSYRERNGKPVWNAED